VNPPATDLQVLVLPAPTADLLLPAGAVAEILRSETLGLPESGSPEWVIGTLQWRGQSVAVARLVPVDKRGHRSSVVVVCFSPGGNRALPYLAIASPGLPRLERVTPKALGGEPDAPPALLWFVRAPLRLGGQAAWLLDLWALERGLLG